MKVTGISGSARKDGNTSILMNTIFEELHKENIETELIQLAGTVIEPCKACWGCSGKRNCIHRNDTFREIFEKILYADGIVLGSPVYSANVSANMQAFIERAAVVADCNPEILKHKIGAAVAVARRAGAITAIQIISKKTLIYLVLNCLMMKWSKSKSLIVVKSMIGINKTEKSIFCFL